MAPLAITNSIVVTTYLRVLTDSIIIIDDE